MGTSSILGGQRAATSARGHDIDSLGPSDSSDSGSDVQGQRRLATIPEEGELGGATPIESRSDTDASGTGERGGAIPEGASEAADIAPDRIDRLVADDDDDTDSPLSTGLDDLAVDDDEEEEP